jgi:chemotaxis protein MotA
MRSSVVGLFLGIGIIYYALLNTGNDSSVYMNLVSMIIVFGGSFSVAIITQGLKKTFSIMLLFFKAFSTGKYNNVSIVEELVNISKKVYFGKVSLDSFNQDDAHPFAVDGLRLIHNKIETKKIQKIMMTMLQSRQEDHDAKVEQLEILAKYPPAFGMMGTIIGLVAVLNQMNSADQMTSIGPSMAIALVTTLYGIFLANYIIQPIADNLMARGQVDIKIRVIILEAIILISKNEDPVFTREMLLGHLSPAQRDEYYKLNTSEMNNISGVAA